MGENKNSQGNFNREKKIKTLQLRRLVKQEKENRELRKQITTLLNYQRDLEKQVEKLIEYDEEISRNNISIEKLLKEKQQYEKALQSAQEKKDEEQSDFFRIMLQDNNTELNRLKQLNYELKHGNKNVDNHLDDIQDVLDNVDGSLKENFDNIVESLQLMSVKDTIENTLDEVNATLNDALNLWNLSAEEDVKYKKLFTEQLKESVKRTNGMLNASDQANTLLALQGAGVSIENAAKVWESVALSEKLLGQDLTGYNNIVTFADSSSDIEAITGSILNSGATDKSEILSAIDTLAPALAGSGMSDKEQAEYLEQAIKFMGQLQAQGLAGTGAVQDYADRLTASLGSTYLDFGANSTKFGHEGAQHISTRNIELITKGYAGMLEKSKIYQSDSAQQNYGLSEDIHQRVKEQNITDEALLKGQDKLLKEDYFKTYTNSIENYHTTMIDEIKNKVSPYLMNISNTVNELGLDISDLWFGVGIVKNAIEIFGKVKGFSLEGLKGKAAVDATSKAADTGTSWSSWFSNLFKGGAPADFDKLGDESIKSFKDQPKYNDLSDEEKEKWSIVEDSMKKTPTLLESLLNLFKKDDVVKSESQFDSYKPHRDGLDNVPFDGYKAILHSGEMVLTREDADVYRRYQDNIAVQDAFAERSHSLLSQLKSDAILGAAKESAGAMFERLQSNTLASDNTSSSNASTGGNFTSTGSYARDTWDYLVSKGYSKQSTAGVMGNLQQESGIDPTKKQYGGGPGRGIAQWTVSQERFKGMSALAKSRGKDWTDLQTQLDWLDLEMQGKDRATLNGLKRYVGGYDAFKALTNIRQATDVFEASFERAGTPNMKNRYKYAEGFYNDFAKYEQGTPYVPSDQLAILHEGEMVVPKDQNPMNSGRTISTSNEDIKEDLKAILQALQWGFEYLGKKFGEEKVVMPMTSSHKLDSLGGKYQTKKLGR